MSISERTATRTQPTREHIEQERKALRLHSQEELHTTRVTYERVLMLADAEADEYPAFVTENGRIRALAIIAAVDVELAWRQSKGIVFPQSSLGWPEAFLRDLKSRVSVESLVEQTVTLRRRSASLVGLCPFHDDLNPSLVVWPDSGRWKCFGCQVGGDVISWAQAANRLDFREAVHLIAAYAGVDMPVTSVTPATRRRVVQIGGR